MVEVLNDCYIIICIHFCVVFCLIQVPIISECSKDICCQHCCQCWEEQEEVRREGRLAKEKEKCLGGNKRSVFMIMYSGMTGKCGVCFLSTYFSWYGMSRSLLSFQCAIMYTLSMCECIKYIEMGLWHTCMTLKVFEVC